MECYPNWKLKLINKYYKLYIIMVLIILLNIYLRNCYVYNKVFKLCEYKKNIKKEFSIG